MNFKNLLWIAVPMALSVGVIWLSAQDPKGAPNEGVRVGELAEKLQVREKVVLQKEAELQQAEQRLATLQATLDENNREADGRQDPVFAKNPNFLRPVRTGPFYATKLHPRSLGTLGGVKIDERTQALNGKGEVIPGLYVTGNDAGGMYGDSYDLLLGGGTLGFAVNSGRIAAENAVRYAGVTLKK